MSRERKQSPDSSSTLVSPNEAMSSYIGDLLWAGVSPKPEGTPERLFTNSDEADSGSGLSLSNAIQPGCYLIPLTNLEDYQLDLSNPHRSLTHSFLLLLWGLHLLRKPIMGRLRQSVMEHCNERMMEYRLLSGITQLPAAAGRVKNES